MRRILVVAAGIIACADSLPAQSNGSWQRLAPMPTARQELATAVLNGKIYTMGGYGLDRRSTAVVEVYDPVTNTWASASPLPAATNHSAAAVAAGKLYSINGFITHVYNPATDSWSQAASANFGHGSTPAVGVFENKIYIAGGQGSTSTRDLEVYDPATNTWTVLAPMSVARNHTGGAFIDGKFYVVGGRGPAAAPTALEAYDPQSNTWRSLAPMPTGRSGIGVAAVNGELFVFGGELPDLHGEVEAYNPATNTWRKLPNMPSPRHGIWASVIGSRVYLPGGANQQGFGATNVNDVFIIGANPPRFGNISTRARVEMNDNILIGGFIITGGSSKRLLIRAPGPTVPVPGRLADTKLDLYNGNRQLIMSNDNWQDAPNREEIAATGLAPSDSREAAILMRLPSGPATAVVSGAGNTTGIALVEVYDLDRDQAARLANVSTRGFVQTGDNIMIGGIIIAGDGSLRVVLRALGPSLPVAGKLMDPNLELRDANGGLLAANDDWRTAQEAEIIGAGLAPESDRESAIVQMLPAGNYTALVRGNGGSTGLALVEAFAVR